MLPVCLPACLPSSAAPSSPLSAEPSLPALPIPKALSCRFLFRPSDFASLGSLDGPYFYRPSLDARPRPDVVQPSNEALESAWLTKQVGNNMARLPPSLPASLPACLPFAARPSSLSFLSAACLGLMSHDRSPYL